MGRFNQRTERRRRVLTEERRETPAAERIAPDRPRTPRPARRYAAAAERDQQWLICDIIPLRRWSVLVWCLLAATVVAAHGAMEGVCHWAARRHFQLDLSPLRQDLMGPASQSSAVAYSLCLTLLLTTCYTALIFNFRRHRVDDYRGRYRIWGYVLAIAFAAAWLVGSGLTRTVRSVAAQLAGASEIAPDAKWLALAVALVGAAALIRLLVEMRESRGAVALLVASALAAGAGLVLSSMALSVYGELQRWLSSILWLATAELFLLSTVVYARHVYLDAQGMVAQQVRSSHRWAWSLTWKRRGRAEAKKETSKPQRAQLKVAALPDDESPAAPSPARSSAAKPAAPAARASKIATATEPVEQDAPETVKLSRAERRRLAKERRRQQRAA